MSLPNWYGIEGISFEWCNQGDPQLHYKGHIFNYWDTIYALDANYQEDGGDPDNVAEWGAYVRDNTINYLDDYIYSLGE